ncbi:MAG: hypothetical protein LBD29_08420 [Treponema sp.]|nr:hypothetical protein [Treponema sp.]
MAALAPGNGSETAVETPFKKEKSGKEVEILESKPGNRNKPQGLEKTLGKGHLT